MYHGDRQVAGTRLSCLAAVKISVKIRERCCEYAATQEYVWPCYHILALLTEANPANIDGYGSFYHSSTNADAYRAKTPVKLPPDHSNTKNRTTEKKRHRSNSNTPKVCTAAKRRYISSALAKNRTVRLFYPLLHAS